MQGCANAHISHGSLKCFSWQAGAPALPHGAQGAFQSGCNQRWLAGRRLRKTFAQPVAQARQRGKIIALQGQTLLHEGSSVLRDKCVQPDMAQNPGPDVTGHRAAGQCQRWHAHPQRMEGGGAARIGKSIQAEIDLMMQRQIVLHVRARIKIKALTRHPFPGKPGDQRVILAVLQHRAQHHARVRHGAQQLRPERDHGAADFALTVKTAKSQIALAQRR